MKKNPNKTIMQQITAMPNNSEYFIGLLHRGVEELQRNGGNVEAFLNDTYNHLQKIAEMPRKYFINAFTANSKN